MLKKGLYAILILMLLISCNHSQENSPVERKRLKGTSMVKISRFLPVYLKIPAGKITGGLDYKEGGSISGKQESGDSWEISWFVYEKTEKEINEISEIFDMKHKSLERSWYYAYGYRKYIFMSRGNKIVKIRFHTFASRGGEGEKRNDLQKEMDEIIRYHLVWKE